MPWRIFFIRQTNTTKWQEKLNCHISSMLHTCSFTEHCLLFQGLLVPFVCVCWNVFWKTFFILPFAKQKKWYTATTHTYDYIHTFDAVVPFSFTCHSSREQKETTFLFLFFFFAIFISQESRVQREKTFFSFSVKTECCWCRVCGSILHVINPK